MTTRKPNKSRACVKSADMKFGNDQIFCVRHFDETSRWMGWSKNEFSHSLSLQPTPVGRLSSAFAVDITAPARLLRNTATNVVEHVPIPKTNSNAGSQQHNGGEPQSSPGQRRGAANARASRRRLRPLLQALGNRLALFVRRLDNLQFSAAVVITFSALGRLELLGKR